MDTEALWRTFQEPLLAFIVRRVHRKADAEDILQDVFLKIYTHAGSLRDGQKLRPWIYRLTRNAISDYYRKMKTFEEIDDEWPSGDRSGEDEGSASEELALCLRPMIRQLPEPYRQALEWTELEGMSQVELSGRTGLSVSGAKSRVQRGRRKLKEILLACCQVELDPCGSVMDYSRKEPDSPCGSCGPSCP